MYLLPSSFVYRKSLLRFIVARCGSTPDKTVPDIVKEVNIKDAVYRASHVWDDATASSLNKSWRHLLPAAVLSTPAPDMAAASSSVVDSDVTVSDASAAAGDQSATDSEPPEDCNTGIDDSEPPEGGSLSVADLFTSLGYEEGSAQWQTPKQWLTSDEDDPGFMTLSTDEIVATVLEETKRMEVENSSDESSDDEQVSKSVSSAAACEAFSIALTWLEAQNVDPAHLMLVQKWRDWTAQKRDTCKVKQTMLSSFFKPV